MIKKLSGEEWKPLTFPGGKFLLKNYALSSKGRLASYFEDPPTDGKLLNGSVTTGYKTLNLHRPGNNGTLYITLSHGWMLPEVKENIIQLVRVVCY